MWFELSAEAEKNQINCVKIHFFIYYFAEFKSRSVISKLIKCETCTQLELSTPRQEEKVFRFSFFARFILDTWHRRKWKRKILIFLLSVITVIALQRMYVNVHIFGIAIPLSLFILRKKKRERKKKISPRNLSHGKHPKRGNGKGYLFYLRCFHRTIKLVRFTDESYSMNSDGILVLHISCLSISALLPLLYLLLILLALSIKPSRKNDNGLNSLALFDCSWWENSEWMK